MKTNTYSNSLLIAGDNCFNVSNNISKFWTSNKGNFLTNCVVTADYIRFSIIINPNPVTDFAVVKFLNKLQSSDKFKLTVYTNIGQPQIIKDVSQDQLLAGFKLDMANLSAGYYYIQIASPSILQTFKILKN